MKKIKPIVLKDATKLTNSEMKKIYAGVADEPHSSVCSMLCTTGAIPKDITLDCSFMEGGYCDIVSGTIMGIGCYTQNGVLTYSVKYCNEVTPPIDD